MDKPEQKIAELRRRLGELDDERVSLVGRIADLERAQKSASYATTVASVSLTNYSPVAQKVALFRQLFAGRQDVFAVRWENPKSDRSGYAPACANEWVKGVCGKPQVKCGECPHQAFIPMSDEAIESHLRGESRLRPRGSNFVIGIYPLFVDDSCAFLVVDFDGPGWVTDARAYVETCNVKAVPAALERSRSGDGGHVWIFFMQPVSAHDARQLAAYLLTETMERRPEIGFGTYDRFFPSQDTMPRGGFGNLIALPLQRRAREHGNSAFVDDQLRPHEDQWAFLASLRRMTPGEVYELLHDAEACGRVLGVRIPVEDNDAQEPWLMSPSRRREPRAIIGPLPSTVRVVLADEVYISRDGLPPSLVTQLMRVAAFQNPEFYRAQAMRLPTFGKPRLVSCASIDQATWRYRGAVLTKRLSSYS